MANTNSPFGFKHLGFAQGGAAATFGLRRVKVAYNYGTALYAGDVVEDLGTGYVGQYGSAGSGNVIGVVRSFEYQSTSLGRKVWSTYLPTTDHANDIDALVIPIQGVPPQLFLVQAYLLPFAITHLGTKVVPTAGTGSVIGGRGKRKGGRRFQLISVDPYRPGRRTLGNPPVLVICVNFPEVPVIFHKRVYRDMLQGR